MLEDPAARPITAFRRHPLPVLTGLVGVLLVLRVVVSASDVPDWVFWVLPGIGPLVFELLAGSIPAAESDDGRVAIDVMARRDVVVIGVPQVEARELGFTKVRVEGRTCWIWSRSLRPHIAMDPRSERSGSDPDCSW